MVAQLKNLLECKKCGERASGDNSKDVAAALKRHNCKPRKVGQ